MSEADQPTVIWHLDGPVLEPTHQIAEVRGWVASHEEIRGLRLPDFEKTPFLNEPRPDVNAAWPNFEHIVGFRFEIPVRARCLAIRLEVAVSTGIHEFQGNLTRIPGARLRLALTRLRIQKARLYQAFSRSKFVPRSWRYCLAQAGLFSELTGLHGSEIKRFRMMKMLDILSSHYENAVFLQIGANDGETGDPLVDHIRDTRWTGLLVEPLKVPFQALSNHHKNNPRVRVANVAVSDRTGFAPIFRIKETTGADALWFSQLSSFDRTVLEKHRDFVPGLDELIIEESVRCQTLAELLSEYHLSTVDLVVSDTEGYDACILNQIRFDQVRPKLLIFEHQHLSSADRDGCLRLLNRHGYRVCFCSEGDAFAWPRRPWHV